MLQHQQLQQFSAFYTSSTGDYVADTPFWQTTPSSACCHNYSSTCGVPMIFSLRYWNCMDQQVSSLDLGLPTWTIWSLVTPSTSTTCWARISTTTSRDPSFVTFFRPSETGFSPLILKHGSTTGISSILSLKTEASSFFWRKPFRIRCRIASFQCWIICTNKGRWWIFKMSSVASLSITYVL